jgi:intergrase/recombinase
MKAMKTHIQTVQQQQRRRTAMTNQQALVIRWTKDEVTNFSKEIHREELEISDDEWATALEQFADEVGIINEQIWEHITNIIKTNKENSND